MLLKLISGEESVEEERAESEDFQQTKAIDKGLNQYCVLRCRKDVVQGDHGSVGGGGAGSA